MRAKSCLFPRRFFLLYGGARALWDRCKQVLRVLHPSRDVPRSPFACAMPAPGEEAFKGQTEVTVAVQNEVRL